MPTSSTRKKERNRCAQLLSKIVKPNLKPAQSVCSMDGCASATTTRTLLTKFSNVSLAAKNDSSCLIESNKNFLASLLPDEFYAGFRESLAKGIGLSFLCTLTEDFAQDFLKKKHSEEDIYWINQVIKSLILIMGGMSIGQTLAAPFINFFLVKACGVNQETANRAAVAGVVAFDLLTHPLTIPKIVTVGAVAAASLTTSMATHFFYQVAKKMKVKDQECLANVSEGETSTFSERIRSTFCLRK